jgi:hypothetical protein
LQVSLAEGLQSITVTPTAVDEFRYAFTIRQWRKDLGVFVEEVIAYTSLLTGDTATTITTALKGVVNSKDSLKIVATGTTTVILTAEAGAPTFSVTLNTINLAQAASMYNIAYTANTTANPSVITAAGHAFVVGQILTLVSSNDANLQSGTYRVARIATNTVELTSTDGFTTLGGTATTTGTLTLVAQNSRGTHEDLVANGVTGSVSGETYTTLGLDYNAVGVATSAGAVISNSNKHFVYGKDTSVLLAAYVAFVGAINNALTASGQSEEAVQITA